MKSESPLSEFVAINYIKCQPDYISRFEELFLSRARAIDSMPGFLSLKVLRPSDDNQAYLIVSHWMDEASFRAWVGSDAFREGHQRGFEDLRKAKESGLPPPMESDFKTYGVLL